MIQINQLSLRRGTKLLLQNTSLTIFPQERVGIVGANGAGKSSLFALISGQLEADQGQVQYPAAWRIAQVEQHIQNPERAAIEYVIDGDQQLRHLQQQRAEVDLDDGEAIALLETALNDAGAWSADSRAQQLLSGLGFTPDQWYLPVKQFSGGWQMRLALARALMAPSDLLLLDEPTNHLDLDAMLWLERWLNDYEGTVLIISHDSEFLDAVCTIIVHFEGQALHRYRGNYTQFQRQHAEKQRLATANLEKQQQRAAHLQRFIDRFRAQASKARQAQSRIKALERMQSLPPVQHQQTIQIQLPAPTFMPDPLLRLSEAQLGYAGPSQNDSAAANASTNAAAHTLADAPANAAAHSLADAPANATGTVILDKVNTVLRAGSRIGVLGMNGAGKTTLIKSLVGVLPLLQGERIAAQQLKIGYFAQQQIDMLNSKKSAVAHLQEIAPEQNEQSLRNYLGRFGFSGTMATDSIQYFSGGERARLALALIVWDEPNLLLLDEPTNHLDMDTRQALIDALTEYEGSVLIVSHDRQLLRQTVDEFWLVSAGRVQPFDGDLEDYKRWFFQQQAARRQEMAQQQAQDQTQQADSDATNTGRDPATLDPNTQMGEKTGAQAGSATGTESAPASSGSNQYSSPNLSRRALRQQAAAQRQAAAQQRRPLENELKKVETALEKKQKEHDELLALISDEAFYTSQYDDTRAETLAREGSLDKDIDELEERWLALQEELESINLAHGL